jgi:hypothetical protein
MKNEERRLELSQKLFEIGQSLMEEGASTEDYAITQTGTITIMLASIVLSDEDTYFFSEICSMFSAKKLVETIDSIEDVDFLKNLMELRKPNKQRRKGGKN